MDSKHRWIAWHRPNIPGQRAIVRSLTARGWCIVGGGDTYKEALSTLRTARIPAEDCQCILRAGTHPMKFVQPTVAGELRPTHSDRTTNHLNLLPLMIQPMSITELKRLTEYSPNTIRKMIGKLLDDGLIARIAPGDRSGWTGARGRKPVRYVCKPGV